MRSFLDRHRHLRSKASGFTLIELIFVVVIGFIVLSAIAVCAVYCIAAYLAANPRPDRIYDGGQQHSAIVAPMDDDELASGNWSSDDCRLADGRGSCTDHR